MVVFAFPTIVRQDEAVAKPSLRVTLSVKGWDYFRMQDRIYIQPSYFRVWA